VSALTIARIGIGLSATIKAIELWPLLNRLVTDPRIVEMPLAPWPRPSPEAAAWLVAAWAGLGMALAAGLSVPVTGALLAAIVGYVVTLDQQTYSNHLYLLSLASLLIGLAHTERHREPAAALLRWQLIIVYAFAAASKVTPTFLSGTVIAQNLRPFWGELASGRTLALLSVTAVVAEGFVAWGLSRRKWRVAGAIVGVGLHVGFIVMIRQTLAMIVFAVICLSMYPLFWSDDRRK
jgi:Vitamin K-dependent gamma-carboxylase